MRTTKKQSNRGFSLVELLVAATIVGLLAAAGIVSYTTANRNARNAKRKSDIEQVRAGLELYRTEEGCYPGSNQSPCTTGDGANFTNVINELRTTGYLTNTAQIAEPRETPYPQYSYTYNPTSGDCTVYQICAQLEPAENYCVCNP